MLNLHKIQILKKKGNTKVYGDVKTKSNLIKVNQTELNSNKPDQTSIEQIRKGEHYT